MTVRLPAAGTLIPVETGPLHGVFVRVTAPVARCASCKARILWTETPRGNRMPVDWKPAADGLRRTHFATCPQAGAWRRSGKGGRR